MVLKRILSMMGGKQAQRQMEQQLINKLSETEAMMNLARTAHRAVETAKQKFEQRQMGQQMPPADTPTSPDSAPRQLGAPMLQLTSSISSFVARKKKDAQLDWEDIKKKLG